jgi:hypothetical protein
VTLRRDSVIDDRLAQFARASRDRMLLPLAASFSGGGGALSAREYCELIANGMRSPDRGMFRIVRKKFDWRQRSDVWST